MKHARWMIAVAAMAALAVAAAGHVAADAATFTVNSTADTTDANAGNGVCDDGSGACTLRAAIEEANAHAGADTIAFSIGSGVQTITPGSPLPPITDPVTIDGTTQPGFAGKPIIVLDGSQASQSWGLYTFAGGSTIRGFVIGGFGTGIGLDGVGDVIEGNYIGISVDGSSANPNDVGIVLGLSQGSTIGGVVPTSRNIISGNRAEGIALGLFSSNSVIQGNWIGTDASGMGAVGNGADGIWSDASFGAGHLIGGIAPGAGNVVSGNRYSGVSLSGGGFTVQGNFVGTNADGTAAIPNENGLTIQVFATAAGNVIGGASRGARNVLSGNTADGILLEGGGSDTIAGNYVGVTVSGDTSLPNGVAGIEMNARDDVIGGTAAGAGNVISGNGSVGVVIGIAGSDNFVFGNRVGVAASSSAPLSNGQVGIEVDGHGNTIGGPAIGQSNVIAYSQFQGVGIGSQYPGGNSVRGNSIYSNGFLGISVGSGNPPPPSIALAKPLAGTSLANCTIDVYTDNEDEGRVYYGSTTADDTGNWTYAGVVGGPNVTATCTDSNGDTSQFSAPFANPCATDDADCDGVVDAGDNCPSVANPSQLDANGDLHGDACEAPGSANVDCDDAVNSGGCPEGAAL